MCSSDLPSNVKGTFKYVQREPGSIADLRSAGVVASYSGGKDSKVRLVVGMGCLNPPACAGVMCSPLQAGVVGSCTPSGAGIAWPPGASGTFAGATTENWGDGFEGDPTNGYLLFQRNFGHSADDSRNAVGGTYPSVTLNAGATPFVVGSLSFLTGYNASTCITQSGYTVAVQVSTDLVTWTAFGSSFAATQGTVTVTGTPVTVTANGHAYFRWVPSGLGCSYENTGTDYFMLDDIVFSAPSP